MLRLEQCLSGTDASQMLHDEVFVAAFTPSPGKVQVRSGSNAVFSQDVPVGVTMLRVPMAPGMQEFHFTNDAGVDVQGSSPLIVGTSCIVSLLGRLEELS